MKTIDEMCEHMESYLFCRPVNRVLLELSLAAIMGRQFTEAVGLENIWLMLIGGPSTGKSITLNACSDTEKVYPIDDMTECALISGYRDEDKEKKLEERQNFSVAQHLDGKILMMKDLTRLVQKGQAAQTVMDQLRILYDGEFVGAYGNDMTAPIISSFNILTACTNVIDAMTATSVSLGERFLYYRIPVLKRAEKKQMAMAAIRHSTTSRAKANQLQAMCSEFIDEKKLVLPTIGDEVTEKLVNIASFITEMRAHITKDFRGGITAPPQNEGSARVSKQMMSLCSALAALKDKKEVDDYEVEIMEHIALSSMPEIKRKILTFFWDEWTGDGNGIKEIEVAEHLRISSRGAKNLLGDMYSTGLLNKTEVTEGSSRKAWIISTKADDLIRTAGLEEKLSSDYDMW